MVNRQETAHSVCRRLGWKLITGVAIASLAAGCTKLGKKDSPHKRVAAIDYSKQAQRPALTPNHPLHVATTQWARKHEKDPADATAALNYARGLKALGAKDKALDVLARTYQLTPRNGELVSDYGRLALALGKVQLAEQLLNQAMQGRGSGDWRVLSAMGTVSAKRGDHKKAQSYYMAALRKQPGATSVYNNLALSYALDGKAGDAENLLKEAVDKGHNSPVVRQNLALVLNLQSKFDEAQKVARMDLDSEKIDDNVNFMRKMVKATMVAQATPKRTPAPNATPVTTASLADKKPKGKAKFTTVASAPARTRKEPVRTAATAPVPVRKPAGRPTAATVKPEEVVKWDVNPNEKLPWHKQPATAKRSTQVATLQKKPDTPTSVQSRTAASWSVSVEETTAVAETPVRKAEDFKFPTPR